MKNSLFARNFVIFSCLLALCVAGLGGYVVTANQDLEQSEEWVQHTHDVIMESQDLQTTVHKMLAAQRGYLLSGDEKFLEDFENSRTEISSHLANLRDLAADSPSQESRLNEFQHYFLQFSDLLEARMEKFQQTIPEGGFVRTERVTELRGSIGSVLQNILEEEYGNLNSRVKILEKKTDQYLLTLLIGGSVVAVLLLLLNAYLLKAQSGRTLAEQNLKATEERLQLAIQGTNDGIYDWDIANNEVYFSPQYKAMLGYEDDEFPSTIEEVKKHIHPDDAEGLWEYVDRYFEGKISEFVYVFRMQHKSGRWVWINSRGKAIYNEKGKAVRFSGAHTDVTYLKEYEQRLEEAKAQAEKASEAKSEFLAHMSHEIRTPLTAISGAVEILMKEAPDLKDAHQKLVRVLNSSSIGLKDLINDILDFSKVESGQLELSEKSFELDALMQMVVSIVSVRANEKKLDFICDFASIKNQKFYGDEVRIRQVLINLIGNAIKFTEQGSVKVAVTKEGVAENVETLKIRIEDTGIGIDEANLEVIFEKFKQGDSSVSRRFGGTGLGLAISKELVNMMNGEIIVESEPGKGSVFTVLLPFRDAGVAKDKEDTDQINKVNDQLAAELKGETRLLLVEDFEGNVVVLSYLLDSLGCKYEVAGTGLEAINQWKEKHFDLILMDIQMPEMDGLTAAAHIRKIEGEKGLDRTPIVGMTAHALISDKEKCLEAGMDDYLPKPIVEIDFKNKILQHLKKRPAKEQAA